MKGRLTAFFLLSAVVLGSCGTDAVSSRNSKIIRARAPEYNKDLITVGFVQTGKESDWRDANSSDFINTFTVENGYNLIYIDGNSSPERQKKAVMDLAAQKVDYIIIDPIVEDGWEPVLKKAADSGAEVIIADRMVDADESEYLCWIGSDFYTEGLKAGEWLESYLEEKGRQNEEINIVLIEGTEGASATIGRTRGINDMIAKHSNWNLLISKCGNFSQGEGKQAMDEVLDEFYDIDVVITENDNMMFGALNSMKAAGVTFGTDGEVITVSFDALHEAFERMIKGEIMVSVECNPLIAGEARKVIEDNNAGKKIAGRNYVDESVFTYKNAAEYIDSRQY